MDHTARPIHQPLFQAGYIVRGVDAARRVVYAAHRAVICSIIAGAYLVLPTYAEPAAPASPSTAPTMVGTPPGAPTPGTGATPAGTPAPQVDAQAAARAKRAACESLAAALSGRPAERQLLNDPRAASLAELVPDLVTCGAVATDSDELCKLAAGSSGSCLTTRSVFHELRANPKGRGFVFSEAEYQHCRAEMPLKVCEKMRNAVTSGDPSKCDGQWLDKTDGRAPGMEKARVEDMSTLCTAFCRALVSADKSLCRQLKDPEMMRRCESQIEDKVVFARGLKDIAATGKPPERDFARAALGEADACKAMMQTAVDKCLERSFTPAVEKSAPVTVSPNPSGPKPPSPAGPTPKDAGNPAPSKG